MNNDSEKLKMKYLPINVYTSGNSDCSNNGVSVTHIDNLVVACENGYVTDADVQERGLKVMQLITRQIGGREYKHLQEMGETRWVMFGGNYASTSDSRFPHNYPLAIHDRIEG